MVLADMESITFKDKKNLTDIYSKDVIAKMYTEKWINYFKPVADIRFNDYVFCDDEGTIYLYTTEPIIDNYVVFHLENGLFVRCVCGTESLRLAINQSGILVKSVNGGEWVQTSANNLVGLFYVNGTFYFYKRYDYGYQTTTDGNSFRSVGLNSDVNYMTYGGGYFLVSCSNNNWDWNYSYSARSTDGVNWSGLEQYRQYNRQQITYTTNNNWVRINSYYLETSTDLVNWTRKGKPNGNEYLYGVYNNNDCVLAVTNYSVYKTTDLLNFTRIGPTNNYGSSAVDKKVFATVISNGVGYTFDNNNFRTISSESTPDKSVIINGEKLMISGTSLVSRGQVIVSGLYENNYFSKSRQMLMLKSVPSSSSSNAGKLYIASVDDFINDIDS